MPDDVALSFDDWVAHGEQGAPVWRPRHLEQTGSTPDDLDPQARSKPVRCITLHRQEVKDELPSLGVEADLVSECQQPEVTPERGCLVVRGHARELCSVGRQFGATTLHRCEQFFVTVVARRNCVIGC